MALSSKRRAACPLVSGNCLLGAEIRDSKRADGLYSEPASIQYTTCIGGNAQRLKLGVNIYIYIYVYYTYRVCSRSIIFVYVHSIYRVCSHC